MATRIFPEVDAITTTAANAAYVPKTLVDAKGDILTATADNTPVTLAVGTNGQTLVADNTASTGLKWATPASGTTYVGASVYKSGNQTIAPYTQTILSWDSEDFDTDSFHDNSTNNGRFTIPAGKGGKYVITVTNLYMSHAANGWGYFFIDIFKNGSLLYPICSPLVIGFRYVGTSASAVVNASATDYFDLRMTQETGWNATITGGIYKSRVSISYLGA